MAMMYPTEKLYLNDSYVFQCSAIVKSITKSEADTSVSIVLDRTVFHPQGGGQPSDLGVLKRGDEIIFEVASARVDDIAIVHVGTLLIDNLVVGEEVVVEINKEDRIHNARLHSAGHVLDVAVNAIGLSHLKPAKGYHFSDGPYVEYIGTIESAEKADIVTKLNVEIENIITKNIRTEIAFNEEGLRIVNVGGLACPCGGTHVKSTAELAGIRATKVKLKKGNLRISYAVA